jgi:UDP-N-acetylglucosamine 4,6-dehydratase
MNKNIFKNKTIFLTGGTGSFGVKFLEFIIKNKLQIKKLIIFSRDELKQYEMNKKFPDSRYPFLRYFIGDVRDKDRLDLALVDTDIIIHAAALKQVPTAEYNPFEYIKTNIIGAQNIIECSLKKKTIKKVLALSTDKACSPINLYGATKLCSDKLFIAANNLSGSNNLKFSVLRYGNVMSSRGSLIPFLMQCKKKGEFPMTDKRMTRFNISLEDAIRFSIDSINNMKCGGEIFIPKIPSYRLTDVIKAVAGNIKIKNIGIRPGEKIHEEMININDATNTYDLGKSYVILPDNKQKKFAYYSKNEKFKKVPENFYYSSKNNEFFLTVDQIKSLIKNS